MLFIYRFMKYSHIIWDFNGTILNDVQTGIDAVNVLLNRYGKKPIKDLDFYRRTFCFPVIDYYDSIGLERENFDTYAPEWFYEYSLLEPSAPIFEGVIDAMKFFKENGYSQCLLSATERVMLEKQATRLGIIQYFDELIGQDTIEAHGKAGAAVEFAKREKPAKALVIGDTLHDFEVAKAINADCILLTWGHQDRERLESTGCLVFDSITDVINAFKTGDLI